MQGHRLREFEPRNVSDEPLVDYEVGLVVLNLKLPNEPLEVDAGVSLTPLVLHPTELFEGVVDDLGIVCWQGIKELTELAGLHYSHVEDGPFLGPAHHFEPIFVRSVDELVALGVKEKH